MAIKDYYAILMVHPKAEAFVIEAAYKRLAREYHPDFSKASDLHEKMVEINEAYEVLSDPSKRRLYNKQYEKADRSNKLKASDANTTAQTPQPTSKPKKRSTTSTPTDASRWGSVGPVRPDPASYGIDADYLERAIEGAQAWKLREHRIPKRVKWITRIACGLVGIIVALLLYRREGWEKLSLFVWLVLPLLSELTLRMIEKIRDRHLLRYKFNPLYNANPGGYNQYAKEYARYEAETVTVYVTRDSVYHAKKDCEGQTSYEPLPKWFAQLRNAQACPRCRRSLVVVVKKLPPPFGKGVFLK